MLYEPCIGTAKNYNDLREKLKSKGFKNLPVGANAMLDLPNNKISKIEIKNFESKKTMLKRKNN
jgi:hypothetical protein